LALTPKPTKIRSALSERRQRSVRRAESARERNKQVRVAALVSAARVGLPPPAALRVAGPGGGAPRAADEAGLPPDLVLVPPTPEDVSRGDSTTTWPPVPPPLGPPRFAIVGVQGRQRRVLVGDLVVVDRLSHPVGSRLLLPRILLLADAERTLVGRPCLPSPVPAAGAPTAPARPGAPPGAPPGGRAPFDPSWRPASVECRVEFHQRGPKVVAFVKKRRKEYKRTRGSRQAQTLLRVLAVPDIRSFGGILGGAS